MREYDNIFPADFLSQVTTSRQSSVDLKLADNDFTSLQFFLTKNHYYAVVVDDYPFEITNKESLLEALYYQARLITVNALNWDAIQEGLGDALTNFVDYSGICLLFRKGHKLKSKLPDEFKMLSELSNDLNKQHGEKQMRIFLNQ